MPTVNRVGVLVAVAVGGALGTVARYELALADPLGPSRFPWATFLVNVVGSFVLGATLTALVANGPVAAWIRPFVGVGFCGGLTTFSTWTVESVLLTRAGDAGIAALYLVVSLVVGFLAVVGGVVLARRAFPRVPVPVYDPERDG
jgi:fluoride exporter